MRRQNYAELTLSSSSVSAISEVIKQYVLTDAHLYKKKKYSGVPL